MNGFTGPIRGHGNSAAAVRGGRIGSLARLTGEEVFEITGIPPLISKFAAGSQAEVRATGHGQTTEFKALVRIDTPQEAQYTPTAGSCSMCWRQLLVGGPRNTPAKAGYCFCGKRKSLDRPVPQANAENMKLLAVSLVLVAANAQEPLREYLIRLNDADFPASLRAKGIAPLHHAGNVWAVRTSGKKTLRQTTEEFTPRRISPSNFNPAPGHGACNHGGRRNRDPRLSVNFCYVRYRAYEQNRRYSEASRRQTRTQNSRLPALRVPHE